MVCTIEEALQEWEQGNPLIIVDHEDRENEGDLVIPAEKASAQMVNFFIQEARGLLCVPVSPSIAKRCGFYPMIPNADKNTCNFAISVDSREGTTTGISAQERAHTVQKIIDTSSSAQDFIRPGHMFPLLAKEFGTLVRAGHTEATVDLCKLGGYQEAGMICEILNKDGTMARMPDLEAFAHKHGLKIFAIDTLIAHRKKTETLLEITEEKKVSLSAGEFIQKTFREIGTEKEHIAFIKGDMTKKPLIRVHSENIEQDVFLSKQPINTALEKIAAEENGAFIYIRHNSLQETRSPNDMKSYGVGSQILAHLGIGEMKLLSNTNKNISGLSSFGLSICEYIPFPNT